MPIVPSPRSPLGSTPRLERLKAAPRKPGEASFFFYDAHFKNEAVKVLPGEYFVHDEDMLIMTTLGSCIAACLWDRERRIGGMNHFMLPDGGSGRLRALRLLRDGAADQRAAEARRARLVARSQGVRRRRGDRRHDQPQRRRTQHAVRARLPEDRAHPGRQQGRARHLPAQGLPAARERQGDGQAPGAGQSPRRWWRRTAPRPQKALPQATGGGSVDLF